MILSWLLNFVSREIASSVMSLDTTKKVWDDLSYQFRISNAPRIFHIKNAISILAQNNLPVVTYYIMLKKLWDELSTYTTKKTCEHCGASKAHQTDIMIQFLMGLDDSYSQIKGQLLLNSLLPPLSKVCIINCTKRTSTRCFIYKSYC